MIDQKRLNRAKWALWEHATAGYPIDQETGKTTYDLDEHNKPVLDDMAMYLIGESGQHLDPRCGVTLPGGRGSGKTDLMRAFGRAHVSGGGQGFREVGASQLVNLFNAVSRDDQRNGGSRVILDYGNDLRDLFIDDIGEEPEGRHFGDKRDVIAEVLGLRYKLWKSTGIRTHLTTNIVTDEAMQTKYGDRIMDRLLEMNRVAPMGGPSRRGRGVVVVNTRPALFEPPPPMPTAEEVAQRSALVTAAIQHAASVLSSPTKVNPAMLSPRAFNDARKAELKEFAEGLKAMTNLDLEALHARYMADDLPSAVKPYLDLIDDEFDQRREAQEQRQESTEKAA